MQDLQNPADFEADRVLEISRKIGSCRVVRIVNQRKASDRVSHVYDQVRVDKPLAEEEGI